MKLLDKFFDLLFPKGIKCQVCGIDIQSGSVCAKCASEIDRAPIKRCAKCNRTIYGEGDYCLLCKDNEYVFEKVVSAYDFKGKITGLIHSLKFGNKPYLSAMFANKMAERYEELGVICDCMVAVPMTPVSVKVRGYNQAVLIAQDLVKLINIPLSDNLIKIKDTEEQAKLGYQDRQKNLDKAFAVPDKREFMGKRVLLIDDVYTTGATSNECARTMLKAGALEVYVLTATILPQEKVVAKPKTEQKEFAYANDKN